MSDFGDDGMVSESGNWNVADKFAKVKIMLPLSKCEVYEDLAIFGHETIIDELISSSSVPVDVVRITGLNRLIKELLKLCRNSKFAMKRAGTKEKIESYEKQLQSIEEVLPALYKFKVDQIHNKKYLVLIPDKFNKILQKVIKIKSEINEPLNDNDLIFTNKEEFDPKKAKEAFLARMKTKS